MCHTYHVRDGSDRTPQNEEEEGSGELVGRGEGNRVLAKAARMSGRMAEWQNGKKAKRHHFCLTMVFLPAETPHFTEERTIGSGRKLPKYDWILEGGEKIIPVRTRVRVWYGYGCEVNHLDSENKAEVEDQCGGRCQHGSFD